MKPSREIHCLAVVFTLAAGAVACNDVGDNTGTGGSGDDVGLDGTTTQDGSAGDAGGGSETGMDGGTVGDGGLQGDATAALGDSGDDGTTSSPDGESDSGSPEASFVDTGTGSPDAADAGSADTGADATVDAGMDATAEASVEAAVEASAEASEEETSVDAGADAPADAGVETGSGLVPCTTAGQTSCVPCDGNTSNLCTPTEVVIVNRDIAKGYVADGGLSATSCYECLFNAGCIDDDVLGDVNHECADLTGTVGAGGQASETKTQACLTTLSCIFNAGCQNAKAQNGSSATDGIDNCYCGSNFETASACNNYAGSGATPAPNGSCLQDELDGLGLTSTASGAVVLAPFTTRVSGSGMANAIFLCAGSNSGSFKCPTCF